MKNVFVLLALLFSLSAVAKPISERDARRVAYHFLVNQIGVSEQELVMVYSQKLPNAGHAAFYTFAAPHGGFAIVAGDDIALPILAYSYENPFGTDVPDHVASFLADIAGAIDAALAQDVVASNSTQMQWSSIFETPAPLNDGSGTVGPLLTTKWMQYAPYNINCPGNTNSNAKVGCVAIALGQIIRYWQWPSQPRGIHSYIDTTFGYQRVNFDSTTYNFSLMPDRLTSVSDSNQINETAKFLHHCGVSVDMKYGYGASAANGRAPMAALINYFGYSPSIGSIRRSNYEDTTWMNLLRNELDQGRPILYHGNPRYPEPGEGGHAWVCDGYTADNYFNFNLGWAGNRDGWYLLSPLDSISFYYAVNHNAEINIVPDSNSSSRVIVNQFKGQSEYMVEDSLVVYSFCKLNHENTGYYTHILTSHNISLIPTDSTKQLRVEMLEGSYGFRLYDGTDQTMQLDRTATTQETYQHALLITDSSLTALFVLKVSVMDGNCRTVSRLQKNIQQDTLILSWHENGTATQWQIEYGPRGFSHGEGTLLMSNDTSIIIPHLPYNTDFDYYVRSLCSDGDYGFWGTRISAILYPPKWTDIVTTQPSGYTVNTSGDITISSAEGLAWLTSVTNGLNDQTPNMLQGRTVTLNADIDLSPYRWVPIKFAGNFEGNNHIINNLTVHNVFTENVYFDKGGLFETLHATSKISNTHLRNVNIQSVQRAGAICANLRGSVENCSATGVVTGYSSGDLGGLIGYACSGSVRNCHADVDVITTTNSTVAGGLIGSCFEDYENNLLIRIENCYSIGNVTGKASSIGGFIGGNSSRSLIIQNCYATGKCINNAASTDSNYRYCGSFAGSMWEGLTIGNCYAQADTIPMFHNIGNITIADTLSFVLDGENCLLNDTVLINNTECQYLLSALNAWVQNQNDTNYLTWVVGESGLPQFGSRYELPHYTISVLSANPAMGTTQGGGTYVEGAGISISAVPSEGYHFVYWNDGNTDNPRAITVTGDATYVATFEVNLPDITYYTVTAISNNDAYGTVSGGGRYEEGTVAVLTAMPNGDYYFVSWQDGNTDNPRTVIVAADATYIATFEAEVGIEEVEDADGIVLHPNPAGGQVSLRGVELGAVVTVVDMQGRVHSEIRSQKSEITLDVSQWPAGTYFVRIAGERQTAVRRLLVR